MRSRSETPGRPWRSPGVRRSSHHRSRLPLAVAAGRAGQVERPLHGHLLRRALGEALARLEAEGSRDAGLVELRDLQLARLIQRVDAVLDREQDSELARLG